MPPIELKLRPRRSKPLATAAWLLPGHDVRAWLDEIAAWPGDPLAIRLIAIRDIDDTGVCGVVAIPAEANFEPTGGCVPLGRIGNDLYLPVDAEIAPAINGEELAQHLADGYLYAWLPGRGLTAAEADDVLGLADLVATPTEVNEDWGHAVPGVAFPSRLIEILPEETPSVEQLISDGRDDIGDRSGETRDLPKAPGEPLPGIAGAAARAAMVGAAYPLMGLGKALSALGKMTQGVGSGFAGSGGGQAGGAGQGGGGSLGLGGLADYASDLLRKAAQSLEAQRHREVGRLLHLLDSDPDQGLKFALPFGGAGNAHRGRALPSGSLGRRNVDFSLGSLGGGGPADFWDLSPEYQQQLITKYRELAGRELRLGRHRRAAYIYAELLGDLRSAASALEQGRHYREAAVLYREKLNNAVAAAECLERGELWSEAVEAYRDLGKHEKAGDMLTHIGQTEAAAQEYHQAADRLLVQQDRLGAARVYDEKLRDDALAIETLDAGWPDSRQAKECVAASFAMRGALGRHNESAERVAELSEEVDLIGRHADIAELLAGVFGTYPDAAVQDESAKRCRSLVAHRLRGASTPEAERLLAVLGRLAPSDRLLKRDNRRFIDSRRGVQATRVAAIGHLEKGKLHQVARFELGMTRTWRTAVSIGDLLVTFGTKDGRIVTAACYPDGRIERNSSPWPSSVVRSDTQIVALATLPSMPVLAVGEEPLPSIHLFEDASPTLRRLAAGTPRGLDIAYGAAAGKTGHTWALDYRDDPVLVCVDSSGNVISTQSLIDAGNAYWDSVSIPVPMHATADRVVLGVGRHLIGVKSSEVEVLEELPQNITSLTGGGPYAAPVLATSMELGVALIRLGAEGYMQVIAPEMQQPAALLNLGGFLVVADENRVQAYELKSLTSGRQSKQRCVEATHDTGVPIAVLATEQTNRFLLVSERGVVTVYEAKI
ncbi:MAG: hypothetical protein AAGJ46_02485 [Planctomycetota bacterium]